MTRKFGWCLDGAHSQCRVFINVDDRQSVCGCSCHDTAEAIGEARD